MSKVKLVVADSSPQNLLLAVNWELCCVCQRGDGVLTCPNNNPVVKRRTLGYESLATNFEKLKEYNYVLPSGREVGVLDEGNGILDNFIKKSAKWHKNCSLKFLFPKFESVLHGAMSVSEQEVAEESQAGIRRETRSGTPSINLKEDLCFLCGGPETWKKSLRRCETKEININVKQYAEAVCDTRLLALLETEGDLVAQEAKYHRNCLTNLYNRSRRASCVTDYDRNVILCESMAFVDLILYIQGKLASSSMYIFRMGKLMRIYNSRVAQLLGVSIEELRDEHTTRMREKILAHFPDLKAEKSGREYVLMKSNANIFHNVSSEDQDDDALAFHRFAMNLRTSISSASVTFEGSFAPRSEDKCIPGPLLAAVHTLLYGSSTPTDCGSTKPALTICQLIMLNYRRSTPKGDVVRHRKSLEPPMPIYVALSCYGRNRDRSWIDKMHFRGLSVSSNRVTEVTSQLCRMVVQRARDENIVCPSNLRKGLFTVMALDNIDLKTSSNTSQGEFHGTGISAFQYRKKGEEGEVRVFFTSYSDVVSGGERSVPELPEFYSMVDDCVLPNKQPPAPGCNEEIGDAMTCKGTHQCTPLWKKEATWLEHVHEQMMENEPDCLPNISWSAFHALREEASSALPAVSALLPLFHEKSTSPAMIKHGMDIAFCLTRYLNGDQPPVLCLDQPLFALAKTIQWNWSVNYGEDKIVVLLGPLHIEQSFLRLIGQFLEGCGLISIITNSGITSTGSAEAMMKVTHIKKSREIHQITAAVLHTLMLEAYAADHPDSDMSLDDWIQENSKTSPTFYYWFLVMNLQVLLLRFVRSVRQGHFEELKESIKGMLPWYFLYDHHNYARWLTVHLQDLEELPIKAPSVHHQFVSGKFVVRKTTRPFSALGIDHAHEQNNAVVKDSGGAVGLTHDPSALRRWTIGGPEVNRLLKEFELNDVDQEETPETHHEQTASYQRRFSEKFHALKDSFLECENPFVIRGQEMIALDSRVAVDQEGVDSLYAAEKSGAALFESFVKERLVEKTRPLHDVLKKSKFTLFTKKQSVQKPTNITSLKSDVQLFSRLFLVSTARNLDLNMFFGHENQMCPPSLSLNGVMRSGDKSQLVHILEKVAPTSSCPTACDGVVLDGAALVHGIKPRPGLKNFKEYAMQLSAHIQAMVAEVGAKRFDVAWDLYSNTSLKNTTRMRRGYGVRRQDLPRKGTLPSNWEDYLRNDRNKEDLFRFLSKALLDITPIDLQVVTNVDSDLVSSTGESSSLHGTSCGFMEEADGRILMHVNDMVQLGAKRVLIRSSDTDVVVLAISFYHELCDNGLQELWLLFGSGNKRRYISVHAIAQSLGEDRSIALRGFHAFSGCDTVSFFGTKGKRKAWGAWNDEHTAAFKKLSSPLTVEPDETIIRSLETYTVSLYGVKDKDITDINAARKHLFASGSKPVSAIPPTRDALVQHIKRAYYQAGQVWGTAITPAPLPSPSLCGWKLQTNTNSWEPCWTTKPEIWAACRTLDRCGCSLPCDTLRCSCLRYKLPCTIACKKCKGECSNKSSNFIDCEEI